MKFDKILQYQKIDQELMALENEVAKSDERQKLAVAKSRLEGATDMIGKLKGEASDLLAGYAAMKEKIDALKAELDEFDGILEDVQDANEADHYLKMVSSIAEKSTLSKRKQTRQPQRSTKSTTATKRHGIRA